MHRKNEKLSLGSLVTLAFLAAIQIVLERFIAINTPFVRISLGFVPICIAAINFGPFWTACMCAAADIIGALLVPTGPFFPGFTLTAILTGATYGLFLYRRSASWKQVLPAVAIVCLVYNLCLDSLWLYIIMGKGFLGYIPARFAKAAIMIPLQTMAIPAVWRYVKRFAPGTR
ncbi:MAG: folate family ECF transporter S component [Clostridiales Family XIII bacterium]|jgi:ECF transporter S component (folate family)|nr:folate family ECF transporter S component [Clostridiales Family XIII bacterium]